MEGCLFHVDRGLSLSEKVLAGVAVVIVNTVMLMITADVIMRYVFNRPIIGTYALAELAMVGIVFLGVGYVQSLKGHVNVPLLVQRLNPKTQLIVSIFGYLVGVFALSIIIWGSGQATWVAFVNGEATLGLVNFLIWPAKAIVPLGIGVLSLRLIVDIVKDFRKLLALYKL